MFFNYKISVFSIFFLLLSTVSVTAQTSSSATFESKRKEALALRDSLIQKHQHVRMQAKGDSLRIKSLGEGNRIQIDSLKFEGEVDETVTGRMTQGKIEQEGAENTVDIQSEGSTSGPQRVEVTQKGNNNKVTIRSGTINPKSNNHEKDY
ncbi:MAG: hypothetical protein ACXIUQ_15550 [Cecembia sp.]